MCGIILVDKKQYKAAKKSVWKRYENQKERGQSGFGFVAFDSGRLVKYARSANEKQIEEQLASCEAPLIMFHHRYPTSTANVAEAAHPIKVSNKMLEYDYYLIHNGIIRNDSELKKDHEKLGFAYTTKIVKKWITTGQTYENQEWNDSEALAIEIALLLEDKTDKVHAEGDYAFIVAQTTKAGRLSGIYYGTNGGNPITLTDDKNIFALQSEDGLRKVEAGKLFSYDWKKHTSCEVQANIGTVKVEEFGFKTSGYSCFNWEYETTYGFKRAEFASRTTEYIGDSYDAADRLEDIESEIAYLEDELKAAKRDAETSGDDTDVYELQMQIDELRQEYTKVETEMAMQAK